MGKNKFIILSVIGLILIFIGTLSLYLKNNIERKKEVKKEKSVNNFIINQNIERINDDEPKELDVYDYIGVIEIPILDLKRGFVEKESQYNDVKYNVEVLDESDMPDVENGNLILAAHSGNTAVSYFKDLNKLSLNDEVYIYYNNHKYIYKVMNKYQIEKTGFANIVRKNKSTLTLITCISRTNYQLVVICELENIN